MADTQTTMIVRKMNFSDGAFFIALFHNEGIKFDVFGDGFVIKAQEGQWRYWDEQNVWSSPCVYFP